MTPRQPGPGEHENYARLRERGYFRRVRRAHVDSAPHRPSSIELAMRFIAVVAAVVVVMLVAGWIASTAVGVWS